MAKGKTVKAPAKGGKTTAKAPVKGSKGVKKCANCGKMEHKGKC